MNRIGIIGYGEFGKFLAGLVPTNIEVLVKTSQQIPPDDLPSNTVQAEYKDMATASTVILAVPLNSYGQVLDELKTYLSKDTLVVDVCSVKTTSEAIFDEKLREHPEQLCLHPLFGPQSAAQSTAGLPLVITRERGEKAKVFLDFCEHYLRIKPVRMTAKEHDKQMALVHALTFFTARGLLRMNVHSTSLITPSFQRILDLVELEAHHSDELFQTIQAGNPYAAELRTEFIETLQKLNGEL